MGDSQIEDLKVSSSTKHLRVHTTEEEARMGVGILASLLPKRILKIECLSIATVPFLLLLLENHQRGVYHSDVGQGLTNVLYNGPDSNYFGFVGYMISVTTIQLCFCSMKLAMDNA